MEKIFFVCIAIVLVLNTFATYYNATVITTKEKKKSIKEYLRLSILLSLMILGYAIFDLLIK